MSNRLLAIFDSRKEPFLLAILLLFLHGSIWFDFGSDLSKSMLLVHLGLFLIWQPIWKGDEKIDWQKGFVFISLTLAFVFWLNLWMIFIWLVILAGFFGGRTFVNRSERYILLIVLIFILLQMLFGCIINFSNQTLKGFRVIEYLLPILPLILIFFTTSKEDTSSRKIDFIHGITTALLFSLLSLGSLLNMYINNTDYVVSIIQTMLLIGAASLFIGWLSSGRTGSNSLSNLWVDSLLNIGTPFELWISRLAELMDQVSNAEDFLDKAMYELNKYDWISGIEWKLDSIKNSSGKKTEHLTKIEEKVLEVKIYTYRNIGSTLNIHCKLLIQILENFYLSKKREQELSNQSRIMAIHDTGARITHDIKNILQSLKIITSDSKSSELHLVNEQLPQLSQRLQSALDKLQSADDKTVTLIELEVWWSGIKTFHENKHISFEEKISTKKFLIPEELFNTVIDNVLENFHRKKINEAGINAFVELVVDSNKLLLSISDTGTAIDSGIAHLLFKESIDSKNGLGIGLLQSAKLAESLGYELKLTNNIQGNVRFVLSKKLG